MVVGRGMSFPFANSFSGRAIRRAEGQPQDMRPDVFRPIRDPLRQPRMTVGEESAGRFFIARQITCDREHELIRSLLSGASLLSRNTVSFGLIHQPPKRCGRPARLCGQPFPLSWQQRHFARDDSQFRSSPPSRLRSVFFFVLRRLRAIRCMTSDNGPRRPGQSLDDVSLRAAQIQINHPASSVVKDEKWVG